MIQSQSNEFSTALKSFLCDYLPRLKGASRHTIKSYRDSLKLFLLFLARGNGSVDALSFENVDVDRIVEFLEYLETERHNTIGTRNIRLAAIHSFFRYIATMYPEHVYLAQQVLSTPFKRMNTRSIEYFEFEELAAVLGQIDRSKFNGRRDYALLTLMFNIGARVQEIVDLKVNDLHLSAPFQVHIFGKGRKKRVCPIWAKTANILRKYLDERNIDPNKPLPLFQNHLGTPITRFGIRYILAKYVRKAAENNPLLKRKRLHPHSMRHSTAVHLLRSGVDIVTISHWLGHVSINTTNKYVSIDLEMKRKAIEKVAPPSGDRAPWRNDHNILTWLEAL